MKRIALLLLLIIPIVGHATVTTQTTSVSFTCTGSIGPYPFAYPITDATAMTVTQNGTLLAPTSYTVSPVNNNYVNGGSVTLNTACPSGGNILLLVRATPLTQTTVFTDNMPVPMKSIERGLDKLTEIAQEKAVEINGVPFCSGFAPTAGQIVEYATTSTPNPCWQAVNGGTVTGITAVTATAPVDCTTSGSSVNCGLSGGAVYASSYGAMGNWRSVSDAVVVAGSTTLTSATANFTSIDNTKNILVNMGPLEITGGSYISGITATGTAGQTCLLSGFNGSGSSATAYIMLSAANTVGSLIEMTAYGSGYSGTISTAAVASGTATCSGTATVSMTTMPSPVQTTLTVTNSTTVTLGTAATTSANPTVASLGTDDTANLQTARSVANAAGVPLYLPPGKYLVKGSGACILNDQTGTIGQGMFASEFVVDWSTPQTTDVDCVTATTAGIAGANWNNFGFGTNADQNNQGNLSAPAIKPARYDLRFDASVGAETQLLVQQIFTNSVASSAAAVYLDGDIFDSTIRNSYLGGGMAYNNVADSIHVQYTVIYGNKSCISGNFAAGASEPTWEGDTFVCLQGGIEVLAGGVFRPSVLNDYIENGQPGYNPSKPGISLLGISGQPAVAPAISGSFVSDALTPGTDAIDLDYAFWPTIDSNTIYATLGTAAEVRVTANTVNLYMGQNQCYANICQVAGPGVNTAFATAYRRSNGTTGPTYLDSVSGYGPFGQGPEPVGMPLAIPGYNNQPASQIEDITICPSPNTADWCLNGVDQGARTGLLQPIYFTVFPVNTYVSGTRIKTVTNCAGLNSGDTITAGVGLAQDGFISLIPTFNLATASPNTLDSSSGISKSGVVNPGIYLQMTTSAGDTWATPTACHIAVWVFYSTLQAPSL